MSSELIIAGALLIALTVYLLTGGADYGAGVWYLFATAAVGLAAFVCLWQRRFRWARLCIVGQVTVTLWAWAFAQFPYLVPPHLTIYNAAAPTQTLQWLLLALCVGAVLLFPSLWYLFRIFKQQALFSHDDPPPSGERKPGGGHT